MQSIRNIHQIFPLVVNNNHDSRTSSQNLDYMKFNDFYTNGKQNQPNLFLKLIFILYKMYDTLMKSQTRKKFGDYEKSVNKIYNI